MIERQRRTKILATLGPATDAPGVLDDLFRAGVNVVRLNFSHGDPSGQAKRAAEVRAAAGLLAETPGERDVVDGGRPVLGGGGPGEAEGHGADDGGRSGVTKTLRKTHGLLPAP